jgi:Domain of unknown function (DUF5666)
MAGLLSLAILASLIGGGAGQMPASQQQTISGTLITIGKGSLSLQLNHKVRVVYVGPDTEIWRRGKDLKSISQLVLGEMIYAGYIDVDSEGVPLATIVAEVPADHAVALIPHHIRERDACVGIAELVTPTTITVYEDNRTCVVRVGKNTEIWKGASYRTTSVVHKGDDVAAGGTPDYATGELIADSVEVDVGKTEGTVVFMNADRFVVNQYPEADPESAYPRGNLTVVMDRRTQFEGCERKDLKINANVMVIGLELKDDSLRATRIWLER